MSLDELVQDMIGQKWAANKDRQDGATALFKADTAAHDRTYRQLCDLHSEVCKVNDLIREASYA
jgi:hypothetical protein